MRDPDGLTLLRDGVPDVLGQMDGGLVEILHVASSLHLEHLIGLADVDHQAGTHQVGPECDLGGPEAVNVKNVLKHGRVQHYVPMVGHEKIVSRRIQILDP